MNKKWIYSILFIITLMLFNINVVYADVYRAKISGTSVRARSGAGTNYSVVVEDLGNNSEYTMVSNTLHKSEKGCDAGWYQININSTTTGYVCSDYVQVTKIVVNGETQTACENELKGKGFPQSYWKGLCELKAIYPNWKFTPVFTGLDFSEAVNKEAACGKSYIASSKAEDIDTSCKNPYSNTWYPASTTAVARYMDPRNWFTEKRMFQFEGITYNSALSSIYPASANYSYKNAEFYKYHGTNLGTHVTNAGRDTNVSPVFLASRMLQELGNKTTLYNLYSGVYTGYDNKYYGYYNFFNFGVSDSCANTNGTTYCGLNYAYKNGWNSVYNAIKGASTQIHNNYIDAGQYTGYFQKYNVVPKNASSRYTHQYMTNIAAPSSESTTVYNSYKNQNILNNAFEFFIPVYNNIDSSIYNVSNGAVGDIPEEKLSDLGMNTIITSAGLSRSDSYLYGAGAGSTAKSLISQIESISGSGTVFVYNTSDNRVTDGAIGTGFKVKIVNKEGATTLTIVVKGDTSGDGKINALDLLQVQKSILKTYTLNGANKLAGDTSGDGAINALDLLQVQKQILGTYTIK